MHAHGRHDDDRALQRRQQRLSGEPAVQRSAAQRLSDALPGRSTVDTVAVQITYDYQWHTPIGALMSMFGQTSSSPGGLSFTDRNVFRIEPIL